MKQRKVIKGEKHHWWPEAVSRLWENENGLIHRLDVNGTSVSSSGENFARISDGHNILLDKPSPWESTIEHYFDEPDTNFPKVINWLSSLKQKDTNINQVTYNKIVSHDCADEMLDTLRECLISLIVRSPRYRSSQLKTVESFRGELEKPESKRLIVVNINQKYKTLVQNSKGSGKFAVLFAEGKEFIFGDGCYSNINACTEYLNDLKVLIPLTPSMAVIWARPMAYKTHPRLISTQINCSIVELVNKTIQIYSKDYLFYRSERPDIIEDFKLNEYREYKSETDPIAKLINSLITDYSDRFLPSFQFNT